MAAVEGLVHHVYLYDRSDPSGQSVNSLLVSKGHAWMAADTELDLDCSNEELLADHQDHLGKHSYNRDESFQILV